MYIVYTMIARLSSQGSRYRPATYEATSVSIWPLKPSRRDQGLALWMIVRIVRGKSLGCGSSQKIAVSRDECEG